MKPAEKKEQPEEHSQNRSVQLCFSFMNDYPVKPPAQLDMFGYLQGDKEDGKAD